MRRVGGVQSKRLLFHLILSQLTTNELWFLILKLWGPAISVQPEGLQHLSREPAWILPKTSLPTLFAETLHTVSCSARVWFIMLSCLDMFGIIVLYRCVSCYPEFSQLILRKSTDYVTMSWIHENLAMSKVLQWTELSLIFFAQAAADIESRALLGLIILSLWLDKSTKMAPSTCCFIVFKCFQLILSSSFIVRYV